MADDCHDAAGVRRWKEIISRLTVEALRLFSTARLVGEGAVLSGIGLSPEDLVFQAIDAYLEGTTGYRPQDGPLLAFLKQVMRHDFIDLVRSAPHRRTDIMDPTVGRQGKSGGQATLESLAPLPVGPVPDLLWRKQVRRLAADDPALVDYVDAILEAGVSKPADVAAHLATTVEDILNRRRRLQTRMKRRPELTKR